VLRSTNDQLEEEEYKEEEEEELDFEQEQQMLQEEERAAAECRRQEVEIVARAEEAAKVSARAVPDFTKLHKLEEQRGARWKLHHKKELTGCRVFCVCVCVCVCVFGPVKLLFAGLQVPSHPPPLTASESLPILTVPKGFKNNPAPPNVSGYEQSAGQMSG
jgi:hypothetical protein